jgi:hypothetical protein
MDLRAAMRCHLTSLGSGAKRLISISSRSDLPATWVIQESQEGQPAVVNMAQPLQE